MEQNQELTFYYVENKCPSQNINAGWDIWIYLVSRRPQNSNTTPERIIENVYRCSMEKFNPLSQIKFSKFCFKKVVK